LQKHYRKNLIAATKRARADLIDYNVGYFGGVVVVAKFLHFQENAVLESGDTAINK
jgi:hypothetical protein